jgi:hypothetical protein
MHEPIGADLRCRNPAGSKQMPQCDSLLLPQHDGLVTTCIAYPPQHRFGIASVPVRAAAGSGRLHFAAP